MGRGRAYVAISQSAHNWPHEEDSAIQKSQLLCAATGECPGGLGGKEDDDIGMFMACVYLLVHSCVSGQVGGSRFPLFSE